ncbi:MAG TPA: alpha/beta hydrolase [Acetobacteraceae bacterium]|nr:alpha/beta hydrolase [Acetobacteraceae bacterium]
MDEESGTLDRGDSAGLAWQRLAGRSPTVVFLPGLRSDMRGEKATMLAAFCAAHGQACLRFDYSGHGASGGRFEDGTIGRWAADAVAAIDALSAGPVLLVGSSMGGWIALLTALARPERVACLVGIAAAPDFTEALIWAALGSGKRAALMQHGSVALPSAHGEPMTLTRALIEDGRRHLLLDRPIPLACPVRLLHGQRDADVPWATALRLSEQLAGADVQVTLVKDGDHRLSRPADLALLRDVVGRMLG